MKYYIKLDLNPHNTALVKYLSKKVIESIVRSNNFDTVIEATNEGYDIDEEELKEYFTSQQARFQRIYDSPNDLLSLAEADLSMIKHMLTTWCFEVHKWREGWKKLWTVFELQEGLENHKN